MASQTNIRTIPRPAARVAGISLLLIAILAGVGNFAALAPLITVGDAAQTAAAIAGSEAIGEVALIAWLLWAAVRRTRSASAAR